MAVRHITMEQYNNEILKSDKLVLMDFFADWCGPCKMLGPVIEQVAAEHPDMEVVKVNIDEVINALIDSGYKGYFTFETDNAVSCGKTWQLNRRIFERDTRLFNPTTEMYDAAEKFIFELGKACLKAYGIYEE